jgi:hypothetical protein
MEKSTTAPRIGIIESAHHLVAALQDIRDTTTCQQQKELATECLACLAVFVFGTHS